MKTDVDKMISDLTELNDLSKKVVSVNMGGLQCTALPGVRQRELIRLFEDLYDMLEEVKDTIDLVTLTISLINRTNKRYNTQAAMIAGLSPSETEYILAEVKGLLIVLKEGGYKWDIT